MAKKKKVAKQKRTRVVLKDKYTDVPDNSIKHNSMHEEFCKKCKNSETRGLKDTIIRYINTLAIVADAFDINYNDIDDLNNKIREYCRSELKWKFSKFENKKKGE